MKKKQAENLIIAVIITALLALLWEQIKPIALKLDRYIFPEHKFKNKMLYKLRWYICLFLYYIGYLVYLTNFS